MKIQTILEVTQVQKNRHDYSITRALLKDEQGNEIEAFGWGTFHPEQSVTVWFDDKHDKIKFKKFKPTWLT